MKKFISPLMNNHLVRDVLRKKILEDESILFTNEVPGSLASVVETLTVLKIFFSYYKELWYAAYQRAVRKLGTPEPNIVYVSALLAKNLYVMTHIINYTRKNDVCFLPTSEPYIESLSLRLIARQMRVPCINYTAREYLGFVVEPFKLLPTVVDIVNIKEGLKNNPSSCDSKKLNYATGGQFVSSIRSEVRVDNRIDLSSSVVIFMHDMLDAPGIFGNGIFPSLNTWQELTVKILNEYNVNFFLKVHPNQIKASKRLVSKFLEKYSLEDRVLSLSSADILRARPRMIITNHGSISLEAIAFGVPVLAAGVSLPSLLGITNPIASIDVYIEHLINLWPNSLVTEPRNDLIKLVSESEFKWKIEKPVLFDYRFLATEPGIQTNEDLLNFCTNNEDFKKTQNAIFNQDDKLYFQKILAYAQEKTLAKRIVIVLNEDINFEFFVSNLVKRTDSNFLILGRFSLSTLNKYNHEFNNAIFEDIGISRRSLGITNLVTLFRTVFKIKKFQSDQVITLMPKSNLIGQLAACLIGQKNRYMISTGNLWLSHTGIRRFFFLSMERLCVLLAKTIVADSESQYELMIRAHKRHKSKFSYVDGLSARDFPNKHAVDKLRKNIVVGHMGRLCQRKGTNVAIDVAERILGGGNDIYFKFAGPVEDSQIEIRLNQLCDRYGPQISFDKGLFNFSEKMQEIDIILLPSEFEGFGIAAVEAAKLGVVVIGYDVVGLKDSIGKYNLGHLVKFRDSESIEKLIFNYSDNRAKLKEKARLSQKNAVKYFNSEEMVNRLKLELNI